MAEQKDLKKDKKAVDQQAEMSAEGSGREHLDPEHWTDVPQELQGIERERVMNVALKGWNAVMREIRKTVEHTLKPTDWVSFPLPVMGEPGRMNDLISLSSSGCTDARRGDCVFCNYGEKDDVSKKEARASLMDQAERAMDYAEGQNEGYERGFLNLTAIGSLFDDIETPVEVREYIYRRLAEKWIQSGKFPKGVEWTTEARLKYVRPDRLAHMRDVFAEYGLEVGKGKDIVVDIGYGLESTDELVLQGCMGKKDVDDKAERVHMMQEFGVKATSHALFKPPFLTEREAVEDAVKTVKYAFDNDMADLMIVMTMNMRDATLVKELEKEGMYSLPRIWSVVEIMRQLGPQYCEKSHFFGFSVASEDVEVVKPRDDIEQKLMWMILDFAGTEEQWQEIMDFADQADTESKREWQELMAVEPAVSLEERIAVGLDFAAQKYLGKSFTTLEKQINSRKKMDAARRRAMDQVRKKHE